MYNITWNHSKKYFLFFSLESLPQNRWHQPYCSLFLLRAQQTIPWKYYGTIPSNTWWKLCWTLGQCSFQNLDKLKILIFCQFQACDGFLSLLRYLQKESYPLSICTWFLTFSSLMNGIFLFKFELDFYFYCLFSLQKSSSN